MPDTNPPASSFTPLPNESTAAATSATPVTTTPVGAQPAIVITPEQITQFGIPQEWIAKDPALLQLVLKSESMKDEERKYWFQLLPVMSDEQVEKLRTILVNERDQLAALDSKYEADVRKLNEKHAGEWKVEEDRKRRQELELAEKAHATEEASKTDDILSQIQNL